MKKILVVLSLLLFTCGLSFAGWIEENSSGCTNNLYCGDISVADDCTVTDDLAVGGDFTLSGTFDKAVTSPTAKGQIAIDGDTYGVYISTAIGKLTNWILIGDQS